jgi:glycosyltransferase involved in cell wall biosynthesis
MNELTLLYTHSMSIGYGRMGVKLADALVDAGVRVYDSLGLAPEHERSTVGFDEFRSAPPQPTNVVSWISVPTHARWWHEKQFASCFTMWEASNLPPSFRDTLHEFDVLMVPSAQNLELFGQYHDDVRFVPLGVDLDKWHFRPRSTPDKNFVFLCGGSGKRKGVDVAFEAFRTVFKGWKKRWGPEPQLVLKNPKGEAQYRGYDRVLMVSGRLSNEAEIDLYASAHCYVQPSRGEGFGLQPLQAMAQGCPTILTNAHGHSSFANLGIPLGWSWSKADYFIYGDAGDWWEPDLDELCELMWDVYKNYQTHEVKASVNAQTVIPAEFSWQRCAERFIDAHDGQLAAPYKGDGAYHFPSYLQYLVRVSKPWQAEIAGLNYMWQPGKDYYEPADVKRILFERGVLDPACLEGPDPGLAANQIERIGAYSAHKEWCPTCNQQLNSRPVQADTLYQEMENQANAWG